MNEPTPPDTTPLAELIELVLHQEASEEQKQELHARLLANPEDRRAYLHRLNLHSALRLRFACGANEDFPSSLAAAGLARERVGRGGGPKAGAVRALWAAAAAAVIMLVAGPYLFRTAERPPIATVSEANGAVQWTGDRGKVAGDLKPGFPLYGGTLELLSADSWTVLSFRDGSAVTLSGPSTLTISEDRQKQLHLRAGSLSARIAPQPSGRPMLIHTPTAKLEVLGTQLNVDAEASATTLRVNEGRVRATRLADGSVADVPADHQVIVSASGHDRLQVSLRPQPVRSWQSRLPTDVLYGRWMPGDDGVGGVVGLAPVLLNPEKKPVTVHLASIAVARGPDAPVKLARGGRLRIRGRIESAGDVYIGLTAKHVKGGFAGKYLAARRLAPASKTEQYLDFELPLTDFRPQENEFHPSPIGLELVDWWCFTYNQDLGLRIARVELLLPAAGGPEPQPRGETGPPASRPASVPLMDVWTAAAQGNIEAIKRYLADGAAIDGAFVAPGIPASGATPLHMAVLADQGRMVRFLIARGADVNARAKDKHGGTPLHWAAALGRLEMASLLIDAEANVNAPDNHAYTPLDATRYDAASRAKAKRRIAELLRARGAKTRAEHRQGAPKTHTP